jgi:hypothetical protein
MARCSALAAMSALAQIARGTAVLEPSYLAARNGSTISATAVVCMML